MKKLLLVAMIFVFVFGWGAVPAKTALADAGGVNGHTFNFTFTKWVTSQPNPTFAGAIMAGVVGGDVGNGVYAGEVLTEDFSDYPAFWIANARYEFHGEKHSFIADVHVVQNNTTNTAEITGVITQGWLKGAQLTGEYTVLSSCPIDTLDNVLGTTCFQGTLHVSAGLGFKQ